MTNLMKMLYLLLSIFFGMLIMNSFEKQIENFVDNYKVIAMNAFPCKVPQEETGNGAETLPTSLSGCYYSELNGCAVFPTNETILTCPSTVKAFKKRFVETSDLVAGNEEIFELVYDAMKNQSSQDQGTECKSSPECNLDFFRKIQVMTDGELNAYQQRLKNNPCSVGAVCMLPENVAAYISTAKQDASVKGVDCTEASRAMNSMSNKYSQTLYQRVFPECSLSKIKTENGSKTM